MTFGEESAANDLLDDAGRELGWLLSLPKGYSPETDWSEFAPYTAREMTRRQCEVFERCISGPAVA